MVMKKTLIYINVVIFGLLFLTSLVFKLCQLDGYGEVLSWVACPSDLSALATRPWTVVTYMFADNDLLNTLFNLLCLYWVLLLWLATRWKTFIRKLTRKVLPWSMRRKST